MTSMRHSWDRQFVREIAINALYAARKYKECIAHISKILDVHPSDTSHRLMRARCYRNLRMYKEAMLDYEAVIKEQPENNESLKNLYLIYYKLGLYGKALALQDRVYSSNCLDSDKAQFCEAYMCFKLYRSMPSYIGGDLDYMIAQIFDYSSEAVIDRMEERQIVDVPISRFNFSMNLRALFDIVKENIDDIKPDNKLDFTDTYYFLLGNSGISVDDNPCSFIGVRALPGTKQIIEIAPIEVVSNFNEIHILICDMEALFSRNNPKPEEQKQKAVGTRIDRFNKRWGGSTNN